MPPIHTKLYNNECPRAISTNECWVINQFWNFHVENYEYSKSIPIFLQKNCSLEKLKFVIFYISTNNIINGEVATILEYVCFEELGEILNPSTLRLGPIFWIANSFGWWFRLYDAHWFWIQDKANFRPLCEVVLRLESRPISGFRIFKKNIKIVVLKWFLLNMHVW